MPHAVDLQLPRSAVSPRQVARASDVWRLMQDAAVSASIAAGYPPERYHREGVGFYMAHMAVEHRGELPCGPTIRATTWIRASKRGVISEREVRLACPAGLRALGSQRWVHVSRSGGQARPARSSPAVQAAFAPEPGPDTVVVAPPVPAPSADHPVHVWSFDVWHGWMDGFGHVNHPLYVGWCDEALRRRLYATGANPQGLLPQWEQVRFRSPALAPGPVQILTRVLGRDPRGVVCAHRVVHAPDGLLLAEATTCRTTPQGVGPLVRALYAEASGRSG